MLRFAVAGVVLIGLAGCNPVSGISNLPPPSGTDNSGEYQSETALGLTEDSDSTDAYLVAVFNDFACKTLGGTCDVSFSNNYTKLNTQAGFSTMGWAVYDSATASWAYKGKLNPPAGWDLGVDPSLAVSPTDLSLVVVAGIGGVYGQAMSAICLSRSRDGGVTFPDHYCLPVNSGQNGESVDKTGVAIDYYGRIWVTTEDIRPTGRNVRVYRSQDSDTGWNQFQEVTYPDLFTLVASTPELRSQVLCKTDMNNCTDSVALTVQDGSTSDLRTIVYDVDTDTFGPTRYWSNACGGIAYNPTSIPVVPGQAFRQFGYSFDIGFDEIQRNPVLQSSPCVVS